MRKIRLWKRCLSLAWKNEGVIDDEIGGGEGNERKED